VEGTAQFGVGIEPIQAVEDELAVLPLHFRDVQINQLAGEREVAGAEV